MYVNLSVKIIFHILSDFIYVMYMEAHSYAFYELSQQRAQGYRSTIKMDKHTKKTVLQVFSNLSKHSLLLMN